MLIRQMLNETALRSPDRVALISAEATITYGQLAEQVSRLAAGLLNLGLAPGDRVAILLPNTSDFATAMLATNYASLIAVPLFADYPPTEKREILATTAARLLITSPTLLPSVPADAIQRLSTVVLIGGLEGGCIPYEALMDTASEEAVATEGMDPDPIGIIVYTSGSTGRPKGVAHTQSRLVNRADLFINTLSLTANDRDLTAHHLGRPLFFVADLLAMIKVGGSLVLVDPPASELFWQLYGETRPTYCLLPPGSAYHFMEGSGAALANHAGLRFWINVGDQPSEELRQQVTLLTGRPTLNMYGMTEAGFLSITTPGAPAKRGSIGKPLSGVEMRLVDQDDQDVDPGEVGRLRVRTPNMMVGYWNDTLLTHRVMGSGWIETQDLLRVDEDGDYCFMGRGTEIIVRNGANVASALIIEALLEHTAIAEARVVGIGDRHEGQVPIAFYRLKADADDPGKDALQAWVATRVDAWSIPAAYLLIEHWPLTPQGKIDRRKLIGIAEARTSRPS